MKGRSQRLQNSDPPDDWLDGSWTVDCICGVNFDDGEEMVNCDECGVWVHTRCYCYVKSEESFACDKCKSEGVDRNDSEETEVAQLLVELPTKTMRREASYGNSVGVHSKRPFRLWAEMPMEEKVHVQGIPGGDPALFSGLPSVFSPQLWKCTGYVPKKFNFQYSEFPYWDDDCKDKVANVNEDNENAVDRGAGVLFSLSKESLRVNSVRTLVGIRSRDEALKYERKGHLKESKWEAVDMDVRRSLNGVKKNRSLLRPIVINTGKRKKEDPGTPKDLGKKKARIAENDIDAKRRTLQASRTVFTTTSDAKQLDICEDRRPKSFKTDIRSVKNRNLKDSMPLESVSCGHADHRPSESLGKPLEAAGMIRLKGSLLSKSEDRQRKLSALGGTKVLSSSHHHHEPAIIPKVKLGEGVPADRPDGGSSGRVRKAAEEDSTSPDHKITVDSTGPDVISNNPPTVMQRNVKTELSADDVKRVDNIPSSYNASLSAKSSHLPNDSGEFCTNNDKITENPNSADVDRSCMVSGDVKSSGTTLTMEAVTKCRVNTGDELSGVLCEQKQEVNGSEGTVEDQENVSESKVAFISAKGLIKSVATVPSETLKIEQKSVACEETVSSQQNSAVMATQLDNVKPLDSENNCSMMKIPAVTDHSQTAKVEPTTGDVSVNDGRQDGLRKSGKDHLSTPSASKGSPSGRIFNTPFSKRTASDAKDCTVTSSSKSSSSQNAAVSSGSGESAGTVRNQSASHAQSKVTPPGLLQRAGKYHAYPLPSSSSFKLNNVTTGHLPTASNSSTALSDEELALLLHQELNSSPRVPRVPRVRHAGSYPQLASQAAPSLLVKRASSSNSKDQNLLLRRKTKDMLKDGVRSTREFDVDPKKADGVISFPDKQKKDTMHRGDCSRRDVNGSTDPSKRKIPSLSMRRSSGPSSSTEAENNKFSSHQSRESQSDDDSGTAGDQIHRTLPELLDEIMSKGKQMTCEELCNAVLPHWHNLRKQNGGRYAYSSPSQAVLDCLRNRPDWARLVDRGPKTISVKKRRKLDTVDSEDDEDGKPGTTKEAESRSLESRHEEFPKGKRKARKRRRLALQGRGVKDLRNQQRVSRFNDEDDDEEENAFSDSSEETAFSDSDMEEGGGGSAGSEASSSSDATEWS